MKVAFFFSTGRTGTGWFTSLFNERVKNAWSVHEPHPAFRKRAQRLVSNKFTLYDKYYFKIPRWYRHKKRPQEWYVETNYHLFAAIPLIRSAFDGALCVHIIRDGRDVVRSWLNRYRYITNEHIRPRDFSDNMTSSKWNNWNPLQKLAWYWKTVNEHVYKNNPDLWIKYEDIFKGEQSGIFDILELFEGLNYSKEDIKDHLVRRVNKNPFDFFPRYNDWPEKWKSQFDEIAGPAMKKFGYY